MKARCAALLFAAGLTAVSPLCAAGHWVSLGPDGASVDALALQPGAPSVIYAGTEIGLFKSSDRGITWAAADHGLRAADSWVKAIAVDPAAPSTVYAGLGTRGVFKSTDGGATWAPASQGLPQIGTSVFSLAIDSRARAVFAATGSGVYKSVDGGAHWRRLHRGIPTAAGVQALVLVPSQPSSLYAGVATLGVFRSTDGGETWRPVSSGPMANRSVLSLAVDPRAATTIWAGTTTGLLRSSNGGATWRSLAGSPSGIVALAPSPAVPNLLWAGTPRGVFRSADAGSSWTAAATGIIDRQVQALAVDPTAAGVVYAGTAGQSTTGGVFKTADGGATWAFSSRGLHGLNAVAFAVGPGAAGDLWLGAGPGEIFHTTNGGATWLPVVRYGFEALFWFFGIAVDPQDAATVYVTSFFNGHMFKSMDRGVTWRVLVNGIARGLLAIDPATPSTLYSGRFSGLFKSIDAGVSWYRLATDADYVSQITIAPSAPRTVYMGGMNGLRPILLRSTDGGATWAHIEPGPAATNTYAFAVDPHTATTLYAAATGGIYRSLDGGDTWDLAGASDTNALVKLLLAPDGTLYGAFEGSTVKQSTDGGATWHNLGRGLGAPSFTDLVLDPAGKLYAVLSNGGLFAFDL